MNRKRIMGTSFLMLGLILIHFAVEFLPQFFPSLDSMTLTMILQACFFLCSVMYVIAVEKENLFQYIRLKKFNIFSALIIPVLLLFCMPLLALVNCISMLFSTNIATQNIQNMYGDNLLLGVITIALVPAIVEETTFRGVIYNGFRGARPIRAIILSGFLFGAMHMNFNQFMYATVLGIVMGFLFEATGSLLSTMIMHFCMNGSSVVMMWMLPKLNDMMSSLDPSGSSAQFDTATTIPKLQLLKMLVVLLPMAAVCFAIAVLLLVAIAALNKRLDYLKFLILPKMKEKRKELPKPKVLNWPLVVSFVLCFGICILVEIK